MSSDVVRVDDRQVPSQAERDEQYRLWQTALRRADRDVELRLGLVPQQDPTVSGDSVRGLANIDAAPVRTVRARILLMGFRCVRPTNDHAFNADGWGDEIFMTSGFSWLNPDGSEREPVRSFRTPVYGQRRDQGWFGPVFTKWPARIESGHANRFGGVREGDFGGSFIPPWDTHQEWHWPTDNNNCPLPVVMWEWVGPQDQLTGTVIATPTVWEADWGTPLDTQWGDSAVATITEVIKTVVKVGGAVGTVYAPAAVVAGLLAFVGGVLPEAFRSVKNVIGEAGDRPIGQTRRDSDGVRTYNPPVVMVDLARAAEAACQQQGYGPGVFACPVQDSANLGAGRYESFVAFTYEVI